MIGKLKETNDHEFRYVDDNNVYHRSKTDYLQQNILGFCGCGNPDNVMVYIRDLLVKLNNNEWGSYNDLPYMFFVYWANNNGFAEHGTSVRCSWLTKNGKELLSDINWCIENEKEKD